ncbi:MAG: hypothetical protein AAGG68_27950 [Bacteroidota bacterium]
MRLICLTHLLLCCFTTKSFTQELPTYLDLYNTDGTKSGIRFYREYIDLATHFYTGAYFPNADSTAYYHEFHVDQEDFSAAFQLLGNRHLLVIPDQATDAIFKSVATYFHPVEAQTVRFLLPLYFHEQIKGAASQGTFLLVRVE